MRSDDPFERLPDSLILEQILSKIPDVRSLQRVAASCRRFRTLVTQVDTIEFEFPSLKLLNWPCTDLATAQMLARTAKGCLKILKVVPPTSRMPQRSSS
ncbi:hypothetical protein KFL_007710040 [Klebsormidium nitens]|uniref:F-box domain-containing protein n=1 Tax=Klebsormidium nitens TaxID=105231 RepID=A0A1Y1IKQ3_KLENI|nr:hypothetical protein KFL_007710040 [Klebsormidium nitens]|eukprot:GAQ91354.1 hypothetical protein KFL_007710040 [Klebsormidium nitens]